MPRFVTALLLSAGAAALPLPARRALAHKQFCAGGFENATASGALSERFTLELKTTKCDTPDAHHLHEKLEEVLKIKGEERLQVCLDLAGGKNTAAVHVTVYSNSQDETVNPLSKLAAVDKDDLEDMLDFKIRSGYPFCMHTLHVNDVHARIQPISRFGSSCGSSDLADGKCFGGMTLTYGAMEARRQALREEASNVLVLNAGDEFSGTAYFTLNKGDLTARLHNAGGLINLKTAGNHEFDLGTSGLATYLGKINFPFRSHNVDVAAEPDLNSKAFAKSFYPYGYEIFSYGRGKSKQRVAVIGITTETTPITSSPGKNVVFRDSISLLKTSIPALKRDQQVDHVIIVSHSGLSRDIEIAEQVPDISLIIGGHSHTALQYGHNATGPTGKTVTIVQTGAYSRNLGENELCWSEGSDAPMATVVNELIELKQNSFPDSAAIKPIVDAEVAKLETFLNLKVGETTAAFEGNSAFCRTQDCAAGLLIADGYLKSAFGVTAGADFAFQNGGGTRASLPAGDITNNDVLTVQPFSNELSSCKLTGATMLAALEHGVGGFTWEASTSTASAGSGRFPQMAGIKFSVDPSKAVGSRVVSTTPTLDTAAEYTLLLPDFILKGGDGYSMFEAGCIEKNSGGGLDLEVLRNNFVNNSPLDPANYPQETGFRFAIDVLKVDKDGTVLNRASGTAAAPPQVFEVASRRRLGEETTAAPSKKHIANSSPSAAVAARAQEQQGFPCVTGSRGVSLVWGICGAAPGHVIEVEVA